MAKASLESSISVTLVKTGDDVREIPARIVAMPNGTYVLHGLPPGIIADDLVAIIAHMPAQRPSAPKE